MNADPDRAPTTEVGEANFESEVLKSKQPVLVEFWAPWSRPCHVLDSVMAEVASGCAASAKWVRVNADDNPDLSLWYEIQSIPTLLCFVSGEMCFRIVGTASKEAILSKLKAVTCGGESPSIAPDAGENHELGQP